MRRTIAAAGLLGLGLLGITIPAGAAPGNGQGDPEKVNVCHHTGSETNPTIDLNVSENAPNGGNGSGNGNNGNGNGNGVGQVGECNPSEPGGGNEEPPAAEPVVDPVVKPVVRPAAPVVKPAVRPAVKPAAKPAAQMAAQVARPAAAAGVPVAAPAAPNVGFNLETAVGRTDTEIPAGLAAATGLFMGLSVLVLWRRTEGANKAEG